MSTEALLAAVLDDGCEPLLVDLTPRLPGSLREMGWHAVKIVPVGYQALRMDETRRWSYNLPRLATAPERTGCVARLPGAAGRPHPLP